MSIIFCMSRFGFYKCSIVQQRYVSVIIDIYTGFDTEKSHTYTYLIQGSHVYIVQYGQIRTQVW